MIAAGFLLIQAGSSQGPSPDGVVRIQFAIVLVGTILLVRGVVQMMRARIWRGRARLASGYVVDRLVVGTRRHRVHAPVVEFGVGETRVRFLAEYVKRDHPLGARMSVLYDPVDPGRARLADLKTAPSWWFIAGLAVVAVGVLAI